LVEERWIMLLEDHYYNCLCSCQPINCQ